jgi:hypothetical protein
MRCGRCLRCIEYRGHDRGLTDLLVQCDHILPECSTDTWAINTALQSFYYASTAYFFLTCVETKWKNQGVWYLAWQFIVKGRADENGAT